MKSMKNIDFKIDAVLGSPHNSPVPSPQRQSGAKLEPVAPLRTG